MMIIVIIEIVSSAWEILSGGFQETTAFEVKHKIPVLWEHI